MYSAFPLTLSFNNCISMSRIRVSFLFYLFFYFIYNAMVPCMSTSKERQDVQQENVTKHAQNSYT